ncbi:response regulator [Elusimicrobiota bacterium]
MFKGKLRFLIADDQDLVRLMIKAYFKPYKVKMIEARNGKEAIKILKKRKIDMMILDYEMPELNGEQVLELMQNDKKLVDVPVILYTAGGLDEEKEKWLKTSTVAFIEKSNIGMDLISTVKDILGSRLEEIED